MTWQIRESNRSRTLKALGMTALALALAASAAWAHTDPPGASGTATAQALGVFSDAACTNPLTVIVASNGERQYVLRAGQSAYVQATLNFSGAPGAASYEGGRWRMTAGGVVFGPDPLAAVSCIGNMATSTDDGALPGGRGLCAGSPGMQVSPCVQYVTTAADDAAGFITFQAILGDPNPASPDTAYAHLGPNDLAGVSSSVPQTVIIQSCGDGNVDGVEECDPADPDPMAPPCRDDCTIIECGDNILDPPGEECDDGNTTDGDGCSATCTIEPFCGDGTLDPGEECDDGNNTDGDGCRANCTTEECGDGTVDPNEGCDDGNNTDGDGCSANCTLESCGDGVVNPPETCDPADPAAPPGCRAVGTPGECSFCGDGNTDANASETCDDGNNVDLDGCSATCVVETPTLGQWGAILLALALLVLGALGAQASGRRRAV